MGKAEAGPADRRLGLTGAASMGIIDYWEQPKPVAAHAGVSRHAFSTDHQTETAACITFALQAAYQAPLLWIVSTSERSRRGVVRT